MSTSHTHHLKHKGVNPRQGVIRKSTTRFVLSASALLLASACSGPRTEQHLLAVGGTYLFEPSCELPDDYPRERIMPLAWVDGLALKTLDEGRIVARCGETRLELEIAAPQRLEIGLIGGEDPQALPTGKRFWVQGRLFDHRSRELEISQYTSLDWNLSDNIGTADDPSAGEFGFCDTCYGQQGLRAIKPGQGRIKARLGTLQGELSIRVVP